MVTNAILGGMADTVAQLISAINARGSLKPGGLAKHDPLSIELHDLDRKDGLLGQDFEAAAANPFDFERLVRFMSYGFAIAPVQFKWFRFLEMSFPIIKGNMWGPAMLRVLCDQFLFSPLSVLTFFVAMTIAEGGGKRAVSAKLRDMYFRTLMTSYLVWPAVQIVNFRFMPLQLQLPFVSCVSIAWTAYLSLANSADAEI
ncbi:unnamed protein product [Parascedosporium putredinis]|uniref:Uncharacterized protein n=1 Tax=Parascedosporium putredinis TaxID=1442378 RepID=A0A9P1GX52_9PEZI|nr:unnamed protein product [Parascedosporium putredinis]CAI7989439.1 unnamed protein product [Parascedosporium putredinis]